MSLNKGGGNMGAGAVGGAAVKAVVLALNRRMDQPVKNEELLEAVVEEPPALSQAQRLELQIDSAEKGCGAELCVVDVAGALVTMVVRIVGGCIEELEIDAELTAETTLIEDIATVTGTGGKGGIKYCGWKVLGPGPGTLEECSGVVCGDTEIGVTAVDVGGTGPLGGGVGRAAIFEA
ncbi:hypothetical protein GQX74_008240 [Glossina fuscipes]|nr:hypothetical protein GQX74_008240 [Glossina fuscipes]